MTQTQLNRAVAEATGESVRTIEHLGFVFVQVPSPRLPRHYGGFSRRGPFRPRRSKPFHRSLQPA